VHVLPVRGSPEQAVPVWENGESTNRGAFRSVKLALKQTLAAIGVSTCLLQWSKNNTM